MLRTVALGTVAGALITWNWLRLERGPSLGQALLIIVLALVPAVVRGLGARLAASLAAFLVVAGTAFDLGLGLHFPARLLTRFWDGFLEFYDTRVPFDAALHPRMHGTIVLAAFAFTLATALAVGARRPTLAALALVVGAGWPATLLAGHELLRGSAILAGLLVLLAGLRERPRKLGLAPVAGALVVLVGLLASTSPALAKHAFLQWQTWDPTRQASKPVSVAYVWDSNYDGLTFPRKRTTVLRIRASSKAHYWRTTVLNTVVQGRWIEDAVAGSAHEGRGRIGESGLVPVRARLEGQVEQRVTVEALADTRLTGASVPLAFSTDPQLGVVNYDPSGTVRASRILERGDSYVVTSDELQPTPQELARSKAIYPPLISVRRKYLEVEPGVFLPPFGTADRWRFVDETFASYTRAPLLAPYRPLEQLARRIAGGARSPYAAAVALEGWFRTGGGFAYDQHPPRLGEGWPPLVDFVARTHRGYCQHFAGAMALMLRYLGIPARVAAGFSSGRYDQGSDDWIVTDHDAHAWVEVWFRGWGWLPFDPTPGRGGAAAAYSTSSTRFDAAVAAAVLAGKDGLNSFAKHRNEIGVAPKGSRTLIPDVLTPGIPASSGSHGSPVLRLLALLVLALAAATTAVAIVKTAVRRGRYVTRDPRRLASACRRELRDILLDQWVAVPASATLWELAELVEAEFGVVGRRFGLHATVARFGPTASAREAAELLRSDLRELRRGLRSELTRLERLRGLVSLRSLGLTGQRAS